MVCEKSEKSWLLIYKHQHIVELEMESLQTNLHTIWLIMQSVICNFFISIVICSNSSKKQTTWKLC